MTDVAFFRCDGVGMLGHLSRSIALAEALREIGWTAIFRSALDETGRALLAVAGFRHFPAGLVTAPNDAALTAAAAVQVGASRIVLDSYEFSPEYAEALYRNRATIVAIDDFATWPRYPVDLVLNFTIAAASHPYPAKPPRLLLGPSYFLARASMRRQKTRYRARGAALNLCIALRGDAGGESTAAILDRIPSRDLAVRVLVPADAHARDRIAARLSDLGPESRLRTVPHDLSEDLSWADFTLCTGGMIKYESIFLGAFPLVISNTAGEAGDTAAWKAYGVGADLGLMSDFDAGRAAEAVVDTMRMDSASLWHATHRGQQLFGDDPTLNAARAVATYPAP